MDFEMKILNCKSGVGLLLLLLSKTTLAQVSILPTEPVPIPLNSLATFQTIDELRKGRTAATLAVVADYYALDWRPYTGRGGGIFRWRAGLPATDDGGHWIVPKSGGGVWERVLNGQTANVMMWGARGDESTDDTVAVSNAVY